MGALGRYRRKILKARGEPYKRHHFIPVGPTPPQRPAMPSFLGTQASLVFRAKQMAQGILRRAAGRAKIPAAG